MFSLSMLPLLLTFPLSLLIRISTSQRGRVFLPTLEYPICKRDLTCAAPLKQDFRAVMTDPSNEELGEVGRHVEDVEPSRGGVLGKTKVEEEAPQNVEIEEEPKLHKLSAAEFRVYNSMAEHMEYFHNHFRQSWTLLHTACVNNKRPSNLSLKQFLQSGIQFCSHLSAHHAIEEQHIFPVLAAKMPEFKAGDNGAELLRQHKEIHRGMDVFVEYLGKCRSGETELELRVMLQKLDSWGNVLWKHLDQEVKTLGAENMRKYWTLEEMRRMPM